MKRESVGTRINLFESGENQLVADFNELFPECKLDHSPELEVEILEYVGANQRHIVVGGLSITHKMFSDLLYGMDRSLYLMQNEEERELDEINGVIL